MTFPVVINWDEPLQEQTAANGGAPVPHCATPQIQRAAIDVTFRYLEQHMGNPLVVVPKRCGNWRNFAEGSAG